MSKANERHIMWDGGEESALGCGDDSQKEEQWGMVLDYISIARLILLRKKITPLGGDL